MIWLHGSNARRPVAQWLLASNLACMLLLLGLYCYPSSSLNRQLASSGATQHTMRPGSLETVLTMAGQQPAQAAGSTSLGLEAPQAAAQAEHAALPAAPRNQQAAPPQQQHPRGQPWEQMQGQQQEHQQAQQQQQQQEQQQQQQEQQQGQRWYEPHGYTLPLECLKHEDLYLSIVDNLRPWMMRGGITKMDIEGCGVPIAPNASVNGTPTPAQYDTPLPAHFRFVLLDNTVHISSGGLRRGKFGYQGLELHMITQIQMAADRFGLPNMEFVLGWHDRSWVEKESGNGGLCPMMVYSKLSKHYDLLIPDGQFIQFRYDDWLRKTRYPGDVPWEAKVERVIGRFSTYHTEYPPLDRRGVSHDNPRLEHENYSRDTNNTLTDFAGPHFGLAEQRRFKYTMNLDGIGCSGRFQKILATGQAVIKQDSLMKEFFYDALKPWVHYAPTGYNGLSEVEGIARFLKDHDAIARKLGQNSQRFAHEHLNEEGRLCYIKVLFEEMKRLMRYQPNREEFPYLVTWQEEVDQHFTEDDKKVLAERIETF